MNQAVLPFYPGWMLVDLALEQINDEKPCAFSATFSDSGALLLDGTSPRIHTINRENLQIVDTHAQACYVRFFCEFVHGPEGPFHILESVEEFSWSEQPDDAALDSLAERIHPLRRKQIDPETQTSLWKGVVAYSNACFGVTLEVQKSGIVNMLDHDLIASELPIRRKTFTGILRSLAG